jgi:hypothetical protein
MVVTFYIATRIPEPKENHVPKSDLLYQFTTLHMPLFENIEMITVNDLKIAIQHKFGVATEFQRLLFGSVPLCSTPRVHIENEEEYFTYFVYNSYTRSIANNQRFQDEEEAQELMNEILKQCLLKDYGIQNESTILLTRKKNL